MRTVSFFTAAFAALGALAIEAVAGGFVVGTDVQIWPGFAPYPGAPPPIIYDAFGRCLAPLGCADYEQLRRFLDRYERNYGQRFAADKPALQPPAQRRDVPPTPEAQIQPAYRGASQLRPEFEQAGKPLQRSSATGR